MEIWAAIKVRNGLAGTVINKLTISMPVMLDGHTQHLEGMHSDAGIFNPLLALEYHINRAGEQGDEGVALRGCEKDLAQL